MTRCNTVRGLSVVVGLICLLVAPTLTTGTSLPSGPAYQPKLTINTIPTSIKIDGQLDDPGWKLATHITDFYEISPGDNTPPDVSTEIYVACNADNFYVAFVCKDDPSSIRATMCQRDQANNDDQVAVLLDTYGNGAWAYQLYVNPYGVQRDILWLVNAPSDVSFDVIWQSAAQKTDSGYQVEIAIPFASLRFPTRDVQSWRVDFRRLRPRASFKSYGWAAHDRNEPCYPCQFGTVSGISQAQSGRGIEVLPAFVGYRTGERLSDTQFQDHDARGELSVGAKYRPTSDITVEASVNPDFSQIEADASQISVNSVMALFYPERRPYFKEGSDVFATMFNSFYTRTVADPSFTTKVVGRLSKTSFGLLSAIDENSPYIVPVGQFSLPTLNAGRSVASVFRGIHSLSNSSQVGLMLSDRRFENDGAGTVLAGDYVIRLLKNYTLDGQYIATYTKEMDNPALTGRFNGITFDHDKHTVDFDGESYWGTAFIQRLRYNSEHLYWMLDYNQISPAYRTLVGYDPVNNHRTGMLSGGYSIRPKAGLFEYIGTSAMTYRRWNFDGPLEQRINGISLGANLRFAQTGFNISYDDRSETYAGVEFDGLSAVEGSFDMQPHQAIAFNIHGSVGTGVAYRLLTKANVINTTVGVMLKPIDRLTVESSLRYYRSSDREADTAYYDGYIARTRLQLQASTALSVRLVAEYDDFGREWSVDPLITYRISPFSVFYAGSAVRYTDWSLTQEPPHGPSDWKMSSRQFFVKLQYLFQV